MTSHVVHITDDNSKELNDVKHLLRQCGINLDPSIEQTFGLYDETKLIATASIYGSSIRSVAVLPSKQGSNTIALIIDYAIQKIYQSGYDNVFVFTSPFYAKTFKQLGFFEVILSESVTLLERKPNGIETYIRSLSEYRVCVSNIGAIVMNANPFTLGHLYLVEEALKQCDFLYIWVVKEDVSAVPYETRLALVRAGVSHLSHVYVLEGSDYVISRATFPSYFSESLEEESHRFSEIDLNIFGTFICSALGIRKRFIGTEPYCKVTNQYNQTMKVVLKKFDIDVIEIERLNKDELAISASKVRALVLNNNYGELKKYVPDTTLTYLTSDSGRATLSNRLKAGSRH